MLQDLSAESNVVSIELHSRQVSNSVDGSNLMKQKANNILIEDRGSETSEKNPVFITTHQVQQSERAS